VRAGLWLPRPLAREDFGSHHWSSLPAARPNLLH
jgi:hypothetical protein